MPHPVGETYGLFRADGVVIAQMHPGDGGEEGRATAQANARLFAAAPDLLAACEILLHGDIGAARHRARKALAAARAGERG